ncbi:cyclic peptide export ABC transporter [Fulvivirga maritima]|uniref:cyclic peptide export ABC transporter n=1 Tax=Fulvivirga maritima TaxID=2904247 RepID=UPI001F17AEB8|nr:cyclic peptide export ABC transporter [Fulvivirga maritima]UII24658.1 cyclic peptide export ABC transporter [Fulvivirga maritima]
MGWRKFYCLLIIYLLATSESSFSQNKKEVDSAVMDRKVVDLMDKGGIPGLSIVLVNGDETLVKAYGYSNLKEMDTVNTSTLFQLASCSKAFTAVAIAKLISENQIELSDKVSKYLPWFKVEYKNKAQNIEIKHLLHHTSGIPWNTISDIPTANDKFALEKTIRKLIGEKLNSEPGTKYEYATINYDVLALIIEKVTEIPFETYLQTNIINPIGMCSTSVGEASQKRMMASGYKIGFFSPREFKAPIYKGNNAAGYVISNADDMLKWVEVQLGRGDSAIVQLVKQTHARDRTVPLHGMSAYAMGWHVRLNGSGEIYHEGLNPNFTSYIVINPDLGGGVAVMANSNSSYTAVIGEYLMSAITGKEFIEDSDLGDGNDKVYSYITMALVLYTLIVISFLLFTAWAIAKKFRKYKELNRKRIGSMMFSVLLITPFVYAIYLFPEALAQFSWEAILVWSPVSLEVLIIALSISVTLSYFSYFVTSIFPSENEFLGKAPMIILFSVLSGLSNVLLIIMITSAIGSDIELKYLIAYYILILSVYLLGRRFVQTNLIRFARGLVYDLRIELIDKIFSTSYEKFEYLDRGRVYTALNDDVNNIGGSTNMFASLITNTITALGAFVYLASIAFWATILTLFLIVTLTVIYFLVGRSTNVYYENARDERNVFMRLVNGMIDGFKEISLHQFKKLSYKDDVAQSAKFYKEKISTADIRFVNAFLVGESLLVVLLGIVAFGMPKLFTNIELHVLMSFVVILLYLIGPINTILGAIPTMMQLKVAWNRLKQFKKDIPANLKLEIMPISFPKTDSFEVRGVSYSYKNQNGDNSFEVGPINLRAEAGEIIFVIGGNGSGKTTFAKLITGLYTPDKGNILINGHNIDIACAGEFFSTIFSPAHLFKKIYSKKQFQQDDHNHLLELLQLAHKVQIDNNSYSTIKLSAGQLKRLAMFQCYLEDSPIYLFDEWAADQDPEFRQFYYRALLPEMKKMGKIVIAITHDDNYFDVADRLYKMDQGKLKLYHKEDTMVF